MQSAPGGTGMRRTPDQPEPRRIVLEAPRGAFLTSIAARVRYGFFSGSFFSGSFFSGSGSFFGSGGRMGGV